MGPWTSNQPNPSADWPNPTQSTISEKIWTQPNNNGAYSLVVMYFYTQNSSHLTQPSINLFMFFIDRALNALPQFFQIFSTGYFCYSGPNPTQQKLKNLDPTHPNPWTTLR